MVDLMRGEKVAALWSQKIWSEIGKTLAFVETKQAAPNPPRRPGAAFLPSIRLRKLAYVLGTTEIYRDSFSIAQDVMLSRPVTQI